MKKTEQKISTLKEWLDKPNELSLHPSEVAYLLKKIHKKTPEQCFVFLKQIPKDDLGEVLLELPERIKDEALVKLSIKDLVNAVENMDSDDATDLINDIEEISEIKSNEIVTTLDLEHQKDITELKKYEENQAGAYMQTELLSATVDETLAQAIERLRTLKKSGDIEDVYQLFIVDQNNILLGGIGMADLILYENINDKLGAIFNSQEMELHSVNALDHIEDVARLVEQYDYSVVPVIDWQGKLLGQITADDIYDLLEEIATDQIYQMAGVDDEIEADDDLKEIIKNRASWLGINLITAIVASIVIGMFDEILQAFIPLAILMPIVASMGGNAGTQTLTVMVRQIALGEIEFENAKEAITKELIVSLVNGIIFATLIGIIAYFWFKIPLLGVVIALAMLINLLGAGFFGAIIPLILKRLEIDPAIASTVLLTTATDVIGFLGFLGLAKIILL